MAHFDYSVPVEFPLRSTGKSLRFYLQLVLAPTLFAASICLSLGSCSLGDSGTMWTDEPEFAIYAELFNSAQSTYRMEVQYRENLPKSLSETGDHPDIAVGRYLKGSQVRQYFRALDNLFSDLLVNQASFYPNLINLGNVDGRQLLLPVSFDMPLVFFARKNADIARTETVITLDEIKETSKNYNKVLNGTYAQLGFSPRWGRSFLFVIAELYGADFREGKPLAWNESALQKSISFVRDWVTEANGSASAEDDFQFKYLYSPDYQSVADGRIRFAYRDSESYFLLPEEKRVALDFLWVAKDGKIPINENISYLAICRRAGNHQAAEAFIKWFFKEESQKEMLDWESKNRSLERSFGIAGGFSSIKSVNEEIFPLFYPTLAGRLPPSDYLKTPRILPKNWEEIKDAVVLPFLSDAVSIQESEERKLPLLPFQDRIAEWQKRNSQQ